MDLTIRPIKVDEKLKHPDVAHEVLPQHEFSMLIVAPKGSGKTNLICNMILNLYKGYFHKILIISPTVNNDEKWDVVKKAKHVLKENKRLEKYLGPGQDGPPVKVPKIVFKQNEDKSDRKEKNFDGKIPEEWFFSDMEDLFPHLSEQQNTINQLREKLDERAKYVANRLLIVLDDQAGLFQVGNSPMTNYVIRHRHYSSSLIVVTQAYKAIPKTIRTNMNAYVLFEIGNQAEIQSIYEENNQQLDQKTWNKLYRHAVKEPFNFLYMNNKFPKGHRLFKNFTHALVVEESQSDIVSAGNSLSADNSPSSQSKDDKSSKPGSKDTCREMKAENSGKQR